MNKIKIEQPIIINDEQSIRAFLKLCIVDLGLGRGFHPDTPFADYVYTAGADKDQLVFTKPQAKALDKALKQCFEKCSELNIDIYEIGLNIMDPSTDRSNRRNTFSKTLASLYKAAKGKIEKYFATHQRIDITSIEREDYADHTIGIAFHNKHGFANYGHVISIHKKGSDIIIEGESYDGGSCEMDIENVDQGDMLYLADLLPEQKDDSGTLINTLIECDRFIGGFEDDDTLEEPVVDLLARVRNFIALLQLNGELRRFFPKSAEGKWDSVEINPVFDDGKMSIDVVDEGNETYWSVYLHQIEGGVQCIADVDTKEQAFALKDLIETLIKSYKK